MGLFCTQLMALICCAMDCKIDAALVCASVSAAIIELETATARPPRFQRDKDLVPLVAARGGRAVRIGCVDWPAMSLATPALFSESSRQEYVATRW